MMLCVAEGNWEDESWLSSLQQEFYFRDLALAYSTGSLRLSFKVHVICVSPL
jgi:hypothetical protein